MRILVLGAGAIGGYFGGRLLAAGRDVTFLVRPQRKQLLSKHGLKIVSQSGDLHLRDVPTVTENDPIEPYDLVLVTCKSYDLSSALDAIAPAVGKGTIVLPLLNGMRHFEVISDRFPEAIVPAGTCFISTRVEENGLIRHLSDVHIIVYGPRSLEQKLACERLESVLGNAGFEIRHSQDILQEIWEKWLFIASMAAMTCLMRSTIGDIVAAGGAEIARQLMDEASAIASAAGYPPRQAAYDFALERLIAPDSPIAASMLGDIERNHKTEAAHIIGDLLSRRKNVPSPDFSLLRLAWLHLETYRIRQERLAATTPNQLQ